MASILSYIARICHSQFKYNYLKNEKLFLNFLLHLWNLHQISNILEKKIIDIGNAFRKLQTVKNFTGTLCKKRRFGTRFDSQHVKVSKILAKSPWERFYDVFWSFWEKFIWEMSPVLLAEILGMLLSKVTAEGKYPIEDWENLQLPI